MDAPPAPEEAVTCSYCGRRFPSERLRALHHGSEHTHEVSDAEWDAVEAARDAEAAALKSLRLRVLVVLVLLYFTFLLVYVVV
jgi:hypothetical protein